MAGVLSPSPTLAPPSRLAITAGAVTVALVAAAWRVLTFSGFNNDHYIYMAGGQQMLLGEWPVRDFVDPGWPLMYATSAVARALFGRALWVELLVVACAFAIGAAFTLLAARRLAQSFTIALIVTAIEIAISPRSFGYPKIALYSVAAWLIVLMASRMTVGRTIGLAFLTVVAFLFRHDHGLYLGAGALAVVVMGKWADAPRQVAVRAAIFLVSVGLMLLPWVLFVQHYVGVMAYIRPALEFSRAEAEGTLLRTLPRFRLTGRVLTQTNLEIWLFYLFHLIPITSVLLALLRARRGVERWPGESAAVTALCVTAVAINFGFIRTPLAARLPDAIVPAAVLGAWLIANAWDVRGRAPRLAWGVTSVLMLLLTAWAVVVMADVRNLLNSAGILNRRGAMVERIADLRARLRRPMPERNHVPSRNSEALMPFYRFVGRCTVPSDRLVMTGLSPDVFVLANRGFAGGQMAFRPSFYTSRPDQERALARLRAQSVPFVIVSLEEESGFRGAMPRIASYVDEHYDKLALIRVPDTRGLQLYVERGRRPAEIDRDTGWPCFVAH